MMSREPLLVCENLRRHYHLGGETIHALRGVNLTIAPGEFMAIAGPSGSGKSTLLHLMGALDHPTSGSITLRGVDLSTLGRSALAALRRQHIGFVFQSYNLVPVLSALENVEYVMLLQGVDKATRTARCLEVLEEVGLAGMAHRRPAQLSGGQQQRVAVARAIAGRPGLVLADEPTANLDSATASGLLDLMETLNRQHGVTFVFSTHDPLVMQRARRLVRLRDGEVESDTHKNGGEG